MRVPVKSVAIPEEVRERPVLSLLSQDFLRSAGGEGVAGGDAD